MQQIITGNDVIYIQPPMNVVRMFKMLFLGVDIFPSGIIKKETTEVKENG
jgi:hypothetical protein